MWFENEEQMKECMEGLKGQPSMEESIARTEEAAEQIGLRRNYAKGSAEQGHFLGLDLSNSASIAGPATSISIPANINTGGRIQATFAAGYYSPESYTSGTPMDPSRIRDERTEGRVYSGTMLNNLSTDNVKHGVEIGGIKTKEGFEMQCLYNVIVVSKKGEILLDEKVVAMTPKEAEFEARVDILLRDSELKPGDVNVIAHMISTVEIKKDEK